MTAFAGVGVLAESEHSLPAGAAWLAVRVPGVEPPVWQAPDGPIVQAEGPDQLAQALRYGEGVRGPKALVCNDTVRTWPSDWVCIPEAYTSTNPNATADQLVRDFRGRGATVIAPCVLCSDEGTRWPLSQYLPSLQLAKDEGAVGCSVFHYESMLSSDFTWLFAASAIFKAPSPPPPPPPPPAPPSSVIVRAEMERLARSWERVQGGDLRRTRIQVARRIVDANNTDPFWTRCARDIAVLLDRAGVPK